MNDNDVEFKFQTKNKYNEYDYYKQQLFYSIRFYSLKQNTNQSISVLLSVFELHY